MAEPETLYLASRCGDVIGDNYVLAEPIGVGGMGVVYAATQRSLDRKVAVKLPRSELSSDPFVRQRFRIEALAASRIDHPNVVKVIDYGDEDGVPYLVMEHVAGPRLGELLRTQGPFSLKHTLDLVLQVLAGLEQVHLRGVVHADVKCDNVLIETLHGYQTRARLIDFGIAHIAGSGLETPEQTVTGTAEYLSPEVIRGGVPTFASDVYAIGVMIYELVTGAAPFGTGSAATIMCRKLDDDAIPMSLRCHEWDIPVEVESVVMRMLERDPAARFADARAARTALSAVMGVASSWEHERGPRRVELVVNDAPTSPIHCDEVATLPSFARGSNPCDLRVAQQREQIARAVSGGDTDSIAVAYLELADLLIDARKHTTAIVELENAVTVLSRQGMAEPLWRLLLTLAALYDGIGDRARARAAAREGREHALLVGSTVGAQRAAALCARLAKGRASSPRSRPW